MAGATDTAQTESKIDKRKEKWVTLGGTQFTVYSRFVVAQALGRTVRTIRAWDKKGVLPEPIFKLRDGRRWYSAQEIRIFKMLLEQEGLNRTGSDGRLKKSGKSIESTRFKQRAALEVKRLKTEVKNGKITALASPI